VSIFTRIPQPGDEPGQLQAPPMAAWIVLGIITYATFRAVQYIVDLNKRVDMLEVLVLNQEKGEPKS
jgi:hypothetical protein